MSTLVQRSDQDGLATLTLNRPDKLNALTVALFAELRAPDHVVALDADTAFGRLAGRIDPSTRGSYWELAADKNLETFTDVTARLGRNGAGLYMLAGEPPGVRRRMLDPAIYREAARRLDQYFTILNDTPFCRANSDMLNRLDRYSFAIATPSVTLR